jgi:ribosomal-protein-alanine N-acetyltransferase
VSPAVAERVEVVVREARWTDLPALAALEAEVFPDDAWSLRSWWAELAGRPRREYVVAVAGDGAGPVLGYGGLDHGGEVSDVMTVVVVPAGRGTGTGRRLLSELEARAAARGAEHVMLEVRADNEAALGLYESGGYRVLSRRRGYYQPEGVDALVMRKTLPDSGGGEELSGG